MIIKAWVLEEGEKARKEKGREAPWGRFCYDGLHTPISPKKRFPSLKGGKRRGALVSVSVRPGGSPQNLNAVSQKWGGGGGRGGGDSTRTSLHL